MSFYVIDNADFKNKAQKAGFSNAQFKKLDGLFLQAAAAKILNRRTVDCDFDEGVFEYSYHKSNQHPPVLRFVIRRVGPRASMYEVWTGERGKIFQSGLFERAYERLEKEIDQISSS